MEKLGYIQIRIEGKKGNKDLSPDNYDIREIITLLENAENLLFPNDKKDRPNISYAIEAGSIKHIVKTTMQSIIGFNAILGQISAEQNIDFLDLNTAKAVEKFQEISKSHNYNFSLTTSVSKTNSLNITPKTKFYRSEYLWVDAEFYFYGKITDMGGVGRSNIHIATKEFGNLTIQTNKDFLEHYEKNPLYKRFGIRAVGKQNVETGEIDKNTLVFKEIVEYTPKFDEDYLNGLITKASKSWKDIKDADVWLRDLRGGYSA
ncbi:MAG: hypothetical protein H0W84_10010 [Bacteroidetes bacterium]|nr:hypothetical protein [Bacteroidota bacterium]